MKPFFHQPVVKALSLPAMFAAQWQTRSQLRNIRDNRVGVLGT